MSCTAISFGPRFHPRSAPVTFWYIIASTALTLAFFFIGPQRGALGAMVYVEHPLLLVHWPWLWLSDPLFNYLHPFWWLLLMYTYWWVGADLERWWGSRVHLGFVVTMALASNLAILAATVAARQFPFDRNCTIGAEPILCGLFTVWGLRNPRLPVILLIMPVAGSIMIPLGIAFQWWQYGPFHGFFAVLATAGLAALYFYRGERFHAFLRRFGRRPPPPAKGRPTREDRQRDKRFQEIMRKSGLHVVGDDE